MIRTIAFAAGLLFATGTAALAAPITIDDFENPQSLVVAIAGSDGRGSDDVLTPISGGVGTDRELRATIYDADAGRVAVASVTGGTAAFSVPVNSSADFRLLYAVIGGFDATDGGTNTRLAFTVDSLTRTDTSMAVTFIDPFGAVASASRTLDRTGVYGFNFADMPGLGVDYTQVEQILLNFYVLGDPDTPLDLIVSALRLAPAPTAVPLPAAGMLLIVALGALGGLRQRR